MTDKAARTRALNDTFRTTFIGGRVVCTAGVRDRGDREDIITRVREYNDFNADNDPHGEHDFGAFEVGGEMFFWKLDYYDTSLEYGSEDPSDASKTVRVLTVMLASEY